MIAPKHRISKARSGHRKSQWKLAPLNLSACPQCHVLKLPHHVCAECGYYNGKQVIEIKEKKSSNR